MVAAPVRRVEARDCVNLIRVAAALVFVLGLGSCLSHEPTGSARGAETTLLVRANLSGTSVAIVVVEVTAPDLPTSPLFNIPIVNGVASGAITLRAGSGRTITMHAYDAGGVETHRGSVTVDVRAGTNATISLVLMPLTGEVPIEVTLGSLTVIVAPGANALTLGETVILTATILDAHGNPGSGQVGWATSAPGIVTVVSTGEQTVRVTAIGVGEATVTATSAGEAGTATVTVTPVPVATVSVTPGSLELTMGQTGQLTATPLDAGGNALTGREVTWASDNVAVATVNGAGLVTAVSPGTATLTATSEGKTGAATVTVIITGLDFPGNVVVTTTMRFEFTAPMAAYPATYIWRVNPREQEGYYTAFFHANNSADFNNQLEYYGFHPYPDPPPPLTGTQKWEISVDGGSDITGDPVVFDRWYVQVAVVSKDGFATHHTYYWDWPDTTTHKIVWPGHLYAPAPNPAIMVGDNPWNPGEEVFDGVMRGFQFYDVALTPSEIAQEIAAPGSVRQPWYLNLNPTPTDISDKSGNRHHPGWVGTERPTLWKGP